MRTIATWNVLGVALLGVLLLGGTGHASADEGATERAFARGTTILGLQVGGGGQHNIAGDREITGLSLVNVPPRVSYLLFEPFGSGLLRSALEPGLEGWFQFYVAPRFFHAEGLKVALRYHLIGLGPLVPYLE